MRGYRVTEKIENAHPLHTNYPLLPGDLLVRSAGGTWTKEAPGLAVIGFALSPEQEATLAPCEFTSVGLDYYSSEGSL